MDIDEVEQILGKSIRTNTVSVGIDGAQKVTGICVIRTTKDKFYIDAFYDIKITGVGKGNMHTKLPEYAQKMKDIRNDLQAYKGFTKRVIIEDCWFGLNTWTLKVLAKYATVAFFVFRKWTQDIPDPIQPISARSRVGIKLDKKSKKKTKDQICDWVEDNFGLLIEDDNLADGFVLALNGVLDE